jgi:hypothetical protein
MGRSGLGGGGLSEKPILVLVLGLLGLVEKQGSWIQNRGEKCLREKHVLVCGRHRRHQGVGAEGEPESHTSTWLILSTAGQ